MAQVLRLLGLSRAMVVHGAGLDEITTTGNTMVSELYAGDIRSYSLDCSTFGIAPATLTDIRGGDARENTRIICEVLDGERGPCRDIVLMNAGAAIYIGGRARDLHEGIVRAGTSIDSGNARTCLETLVAATRSAA
jgi:anthranilate phosphoribosyltransferase